MKVWDLRVNDRAVASMQPKEKGMRRDAWAVAFGNSHAGGDRMLAGGYDNGDVKLLDLRNMKVLWETELPQGVCSLQFDRKDIDKNKLLATCLEGRFHVWDLRTLGPKKGYAQLDEQNEKATVWHGSHLPQNRDVFMTASGSSSSLALWKYEYPEKREDEDGEGVAGKVKKIQEVELGEQPIVNFSWSTDKMGLGVCVSFDQMIRTVIVTKLNTLN